MVAFRALISVLLGGICVGCSPVSLNQPAPPKAAAPGVIPSEAGFVEITAAAKKAVREIAAAEGATKWWLRVEFVPGGCAGYTNKLDIRTGKLAADEWEHVDGDFRLCFLASQQAFVQGMLIDWIDTPKETGFKVTFPKRTKENDRLTYQLVNEEVERRKGLGVKAPSD